MKKPRFRHAIDWPLALDVHPDDNWDAAPYIGLVLRLELLRRREKWAVVLPVGFFIGDPTPGAVKPSDELEAREGALERLRETQGAKAFSQRDSVVRDRLLFYRYGAIKALQSVVVAPWLFRAIGRYLLRIEANPKIVWSIYAKPLEERSIVDGRRARGPAWTEAEDVLLRRWFAPREDGTRQPLTEIQWGTLLNGTLGGRHSRPSVKRRIRALNNVLRRSIAGLERLNVAQQRLYLKQALGERARIPAFRENGPVYGGLFTDKKRKRRRRPHAAPVVTPASPPPSSPEPWVDAFLDWNQR